VIIIRNEHFLSIKSYHTILYLDSSIIKIVQVLIAHVYFSGCLIERREFYRIRMSVRNFNILC